MAQDWDIRPRSDECSECHTAFRDKQEYFSALMYGEQGYQRADYCGRCWFGGKKEQAVPYSTWQGVYKPPPPPPQEALKKETAESLLRKLMALEDESKRNIIYILAVMLERKRLLVERDVQVRDDGLKVLIYEHRKTGETFVIPDPGLKLDQLEHVQTEVVTMLGGRDDKPAEPAADAGATPPADAPAGP